MTAQQRNLFKPLVIGKNSVQNRLALAPLTRVRAPNHVSHELAAEYYRQRAAASPGTLLIAEATFIAPEAGGLPNVPGIWSEDQITAWKKVTSAVHESGSIIYLQLWNLGRAADPQVLQSEGPYPYISASDVAMSGKEPPRPLSKEEIKNHVHLYRTAAKNALKAGFDGVEIHNANGYLLDQFLHENTNTRDDEYGGSIENRARFTLEVVDAIVNEIGADRTAIRLSPWGSFSEVDPGISPIPQWSYVLAELEARGLKGNRLSFVHVVEPRVDHRADDSYGHIDRSLNDFVRQIWTGVLVRAGAFGKNYDELYSLTKKDDKLIIAIGRLFISNPDLVTKIHSGKELDHYNRSTFYWDGKSDISIGYTRDYTNKK